MTASSEELKALAEGFGQETGDLLEHVLPQAPAIEVVGLADRYVVRPATRGGRGDIPLFIEDAIAASLDISVKCRLDSTNRYLAVETSSFTVKALPDRQPIFRFDYDRDRHSAPHAHIHVHAHRGALSHFLSRADHRAPHDMSSLHLPVGGSRLRPCLEDVLQFLIEECGVTPLEGWKDHVERGRERWRRKQVRSIVRNIHVDAAEALRSIGYEVVPPEDIPPEEDKALKAW